MINKTLLKQTIKSNLSLWLILTIIQGVMLVLMVSAGTTIPATGMAYYNMLAGIMVGVYVIITSNKMLAQQVDKGTMAYVLSTPIKRSSVVATQAIYMVGSLLAMGIVSAGSHVLGHVIAFGAITEAEVGTILFLNLGLSALALGFTGVCFAASGVFNLSKHMIAVGGGLTGAFLIMPIVSMFGPKFSFLKNLTLVSLFDTSSILGGTYDFVWKAAILVAVCFAGCLLGGAVFTKKDLPL